MHLIIRKPKQVSAIYFDSLFTHILNSTHMIVICQCSLPFMTFHVTVVDVGACLFRNISWIIIQFVATERHMIVVCPDYETFE